MLGHVDHGKTALVRALTGKDTDALAEEKERGISITLGFAHVRVGADMDIDLIDMPGHERFVRTMISGATGIDAVLLVVAANEGIKPQTIEHVDIASLLGVRRALIAISKVDRAAPAQARRVAEEVVGLVARSGLEAHPPGMTPALMICARHSQRSPGTSIRVPQTVSCSCPSIEHSALPDTARWSRAHYVGPPSRSATPSSCCRRAGPCGCERSRSTE
jgi:small GTP-binding protein